MTTTNLSDYRCRHCGTPLHRTGNYSYFTGNQLQCSYCLCIYAASISGGRWADVDGVRVFPRAHVGPCKVS